MTEKTMIKQFLVTVAAVMVGVYALQKVGHLMP